MRLEEKLEASGPLNEKPRSRWTSVPWSAAPQCSHLIRPSSIWRQATVERSRILPLVVFYWCVCRLFLAPRLAAAELVPGLLEMDVVLAPSAPYHIRVGIGQAKFLRFNCMGGPADVMVSLSTYSENADPLLFLSLNANEPPSFQQHHASSFGQWREDADGDHYVNAKAVSSKGGILGLVNMRHFAGEELDGILSIRCSFYVVFDALFWDHLRSSSLCPIGGRSKEHTGQDKLCSGHGQCGKQGACQCHSDWTGPACEHAKNDIIVAAEGRYRFRVATGHYQYFRVRVPPRFPGGFMEVKAMSDEPLVVLLREDELPTKTVYEMSNFDDWVNKRNVSILKFKVRSDYVENRFPLVEHSSLGRRLNEEAAKQAALTSWNAFFYHLLSSEDEESGTSAVPRALGDDSPNQVDCPNIAAPINGHACKTPSFIQCQASCMQCVGCVKGRDTDGGHNDGGCTEACNACVAPRCINTLAQCAGDVSCAGIDAQRCEAGCGSCMSCFDSNDESCAHCQCCIGCLPIASKCSVIQQQPSDYNRFVFVGVFNHRRYYNDNAGVINAVATISLTADPHFDRDEIPTDWMATLYDPFQDIRTLETSQRQRYPDGDQYIYELDLPVATSTNLEVRLYHDRMTLIHILNAAHASHTVLEFLMGPNITHVLSSSKAAPKTVFDFDQVHVQVHGKIKISARGHPSIWCALFGATDGYVRISAKTYGQDHSASPIRIQFALACVFGLLCGLVVLGIIYVGIQRLTDRLGMDPSIPFITRINSFVKNQNPHESTASLTRAGSLSGYVGSEVIDRSVEDQYLHRGGIGDDGI